MKNRTIEAVVKEIANGEKILSDMMKNISAVIKTKNKISDSSNEEIENLRNTILKISELRSTKCAELSDIQGKLEAEYMDESKQLESLRKELKSKLKKAGLNVEELYRI